MASPILDQALAALRAEISVIPIHADGSKKPLGRWKQAMTERIDELSLRAVMGETPGYGVVCGQISQRLICIDFEGRFISAQMIELLERLDQAGMAERWLQLTQGYMVETPSGGWHIPFHLIGDGPMPGNEKLAFDGAGQVLIETRGEGGYFVGAGSCGPTHQTGKPWELTDGSWATIEWITPEEWELLKRVFASFDETEVRAPEAPRLRLVEPGERPRGSYRGPSMESILEGAGWTFVRDERAGSLWRHPLATNEHSARINSSGRLYAWSGLPVVSDGTNETFDEIDVALMLELGRAPTDTERGHRRGQWSDTPAGSVSPGRHGGSGPASLDSADDSLYLPESFWQARPWLQALFTAACSRRLSPDGVLGALLTAYATTVPMAIKIPPIVGMPSVFNIYSALVAESGGGKTASVGLAHELLGWSRSTNPDVLLGRSLRSGEGLVTLATKPRPKGVKPEDYEPAFRNGVELAFDEAALLGQQQERSGSTVIQYLNTAWAGSGLVGGGLAGGEASFPADLVRICVTMGVQFGAAASLFQGQSHLQGFPQRFGYFGLRSPLVGALGPLRGGAQPIEPLGLTFWRHSEFGGRSFHLGYDDAIQQEVRDWAHAKDYGGGMGDAYDHHRMLVRLRWAGILALVDGRSDVTADDWTLSGQLEDCSRSQRARLVSSLGAIAAEKARSAGRMDAIREAGRDDAWLEGKAKRLARIVGETGEVNFLDLMKARFSSAERKRRNEIVEYAVAMGWVVHRESTVSPGPSEPRA